MASGMAIITSADGDIPDYFQKNKMRFMTSSFAPNDYAEWVAQLVQQPELIEQYGKYNWEYVRTHLQASQVAARLIERLMSCQK